MAALLDIITKGSTDRSVTLRMASATDGTSETGVTSATAGLSVWYRREGGLKVTLASVGDLATLSTAHTDEAFLHIAGGEYRFDMPDAAWATAANYVDFGWEATGMVGFGGRVRLVDFPLESVGFARAIATIGVGTVDTGATTTSIPVSAITPSATVIDQYKGRIMIFDADTTTAALRGQATDITVVALGPPVTFTVTSLTTAPVSGDKFIIQ